MNATIAAADLPIKTGIANYNGTLAWEDVFAGFALSQAARGTT